MSPEEAAERKAYVIGECEHLLRLKVWEEEIADRLGYANVDCLNAQLQRWKRKDLADRFSRVNFDGNVPASTVIAHQRRAESMRRKKAAA